MFLKRSILNKFGNLRVVLGVEIFFHAQPRGQTIHGEPYTISRLVCSTIEKCSLFLTKRKLGLLTKQLSNCYFITQWIILPLHCAWKIKKSTKKKFLLVNTFASLLQQILKFNSWSYFHAQQGGQNLICLFSEHEKLIKWPR